MTTTTIKQKQQVISALKETSRIPASRAHDYVVYLANKCNWTVTKLKYLSTGQEITYPQPIGRTCALDCQTCYEQQQWRPLCASPCDMSPYQIELLCEHPSGAWGWTDPISIAPDCDYGGESLCLDIPDPH